jgi:uncharacterized protein (DUF1778 family)
MLPPAATQPKLRRSVPLARLRDGYRWYLVAGDVRGTGNARDTAGKPPFVLTMSLQWPFSSVLFRGSHMPAPTGRKGDVIQIRASAGTKALLNRAAALRGQKLSEFMLESARRQAEDTILDQRTFFLDDAAHARFVALLDAPPKPSAKARARLKRKPPWPV